MGEDFPFYFVGLALDFCSASLLNARIVTLYGIRPFTDWTLFAYLCSSMFFLALSLLYKGHPPLEVFLVGLAINIFCTSILFSNTMALAMLPLKKNAGMGASVVGSISTLYSAFIGILIGWFYNNTVTPLFIGFFVCSLLALVLLRLLTKD